METELAGREDAEMLTDLCKGSAADTNESEIDLRGEWHSGNL